MRASELKDKPTSDLQERERSLQAELFRMKFRLATEQLNKTAQLRATRRDLARVKTVLRERELGLQANPESRDETGEEG